MTFSTPPSVRVAVVGGGPAGLMAAEALIERGVPVDLFDAMPSLGRKFLMAGKSGLNLTHAEPFDQFMRRFGSAASALEPMLEAFGPNAVQAWARNLGIDVFTGTSGRVFPQDFKAAPLLRAWLRRLKRNGLTVHVRHRWTGWDEQGRLTFATLEGTRAVRAERTILALGGASWPELGSDAAWAPWLEAKGVDIATFKPANCGFDVPWSDHFKERFEGLPLKGVAVTFQDQSARGECVVTRHGLEGGPVYTLASALVAAIETHGPQSIAIDLKPDLGLDALTERLAKPRGKKSWATHLKRTVGLSGASAALLREFTEPSIFDNPEILTAAIKAVPVRITAPRPIAEAISVSGGVRWDQVDASLELKALPGVFVAGEMLDWDAPTGGYLLTACMATGRWAGEAASNGL